MVKKDVVNLDEHFDVTQLSIRSESKVGTGLLRKIRMANKAKIYVPIQACGIIEVKSNSLLITPHKLFSRFVLDLEKYCLTRVESKRMEWMEDANVSVEDALSECIKYHHVHGKVICLRLKDFNASCVEADTVADMVLSVEGLYFKNGRFSLMWSVDQIQKTVVDDDYVFRSSQESDLEQGNEEDDDDVGEVELAEIIYKVCTKLENVVQDLTRQQEALAERMRYAESLKSRVLECGDNVTEIESICEEVQQMCEIS